MPLLCLKNRAKLQIFSKTQKYHEIPGSHTKILEIGQPLWYSTYGILLNL